jgi:hypothetical protein
MNTTNNEFVVDVASARLLGDVVLPRHSCCAGCGRRMWTKAGVVDGDDGVAVAMKRQWWGGDGGWASSTVVVVVVEEETVCLLMMPKSSVSKHRRSIWTSLDTLHIPRIPFRRNSIAGNSCIPAEFEFRSKIPPEFFITLAGPSAKSDSSGIPAIARILPDSSRNQWRTIKTSNGGWNPWNVRWIPWNFQVDSIPFSGGFLGMVDGFHIFFRWIPYHFQGGVHMESM